MGFLEEKVGNKLMVIFAYYTVYIIYSNIIIFSFLSSSGPFCFLQGHRTLLKGGFMVGLLLVSLLRVEATLKREFKAVLVS